MKRMKAILVAGAVAATLACSDSGPTAPMARTSAAGAASAEAAASFDPVPVSRTRNTIVLAPRGTDSLPPGIFGSAEASLSVSPTGAKLEILSANLPMGGCFGQYADIVQRVPGGSFSLSGTFTQLTGVYPGKIQYGAQFSGAVYGNTITITATVPELGRTFGPYTLVRGVTNSWTACPYP